MPEVLDDQTCIGGRLPQPRRCGVAQRVARCCAANKTICFEPMDYVARGAKLAKELGWPVDQIGFIGATASLLDLGSREQELESSRRLVERYRERSSRKLLDHMSQLVKSFSR